jgi:malonate-semialdehyde dehydrogenase (acetylating)/methylmalonate-semialdehyde dehydrogenase
MISPDSASKTFSEESLSRGNWIGSEFRRGSGQEIEVSSPYTGAKIASVWESDSKDLGDVLKRSTSAFTQWSKTPIKERCKILFRFRELMLSQLEEISQLVSLENGKTLAESRGGILKGLEVVEFATSLQNQAFEKRMEVSRGVTCESIREPLGPVAGVTPFNFPAMVPMWMFPIALALGNTFVLKPSEKTPLTANRMGELLFKAGLPEGVFQVVHGSRMFVEQLCEQKALKALAFVGSTPVAETLYRRSVLHRRTLALGGAKNHIVLLPDADPEIVAQGICDSFTGCAGQRCMAASVLLAVGPVDSMIESVVERAKSKVLGQDVGAIIQDESLKRHHEAIQKAIDEGAKVLLDGRHQKPEIKAYQGGHWLGPTILDQVKPGSEAAQEELFGPILSVIRCENLSEALVVERKSGFGNAASVFTSSGAAAERFQKEASSGMVGVNIGVPVPREPFSFGGWGQSKFGYGDITGMSSLEFWTNLRKVSKKWSHQGDQNWMS